MDSVQQATQTITREAWAKIVEEHSGPSEPEYRRQHPRHDTFGSATLTLEADEGEDERQVHRCAVLQISADGLTLRSPAPVPIHKIVVIGLELADRPLVLLGKIRHSTPTIGAFKIGVQLQFSENDAGRKAGPTLPTPPPPKSNP